MHKLNSLRSHHFSQDATIRGFTIVELLIVIVVIAILAAISFVAYTGLQAKATNASIAASVTQYARGLSMYNQQNETYPGPVYDAAAGYRYIACMDGSEDCWSNANSGRSETVSDALRAILGKLPTIPRGHAFTWSADNGYYILFTQENTSECPLISGQHKV